MKINIECQNINFDINNSFEQNGVIYLLSTFNNKGIMELNKIVDSNQEKEFINILSQLSEKKVIKIKQTNESNSLVINVTNSHSQVVPLQKSISRNQKIQVCYQLDEKKLKSITSMSFDQNNFKYNLVNICYQNYVPRKLTVKEINSQEDFISLMESITPLETIIINNKALTKRDFSNIYDLLINYNFDLPLINFAIDYSITTSKYYNLSYEFVHMLLDSWKKQKILSVKDAMELIQTQKEANTKKGSKYIDPSYEKPNLNNESNTKIDVNELFIGDNKFE